MADLKEFAEQLVNLTVKEVNELANILKDEYGIEPAAAAVAVAGPAAAGGGDVDRLHRLRLQPLPRRFGLSLCLRDRGVHDQRPLPQPGDQPHLDPGGAAAVQHDE